MQPPKVVIYSIAMRDAAGQPLRGAAASIIDLLRKLLKNGGIIRDLRRGDSCPPTMLEAHHLQYSYSVRHTIELALEYCNTRSISGRLTLNVGTTFETRKGPVGCVSELTSSLELVGSARGDLGSLLGELLIESAALGISSASISIKIDSEEERTKLEPPRGLGRYGLGVLVLELGVTEDKRYEEKVRVHVPVALPETVKGACVQAYEPECLMKPFTLPLSLVEERGYFSGMLRSIKEMLRVCGGGNVNAEDNCVQGAVELFNRAARLYRVEIEDVSTQTGGGALPSLRVKGRLELVNGNVDLYCSIKDRPEPPTCTRLAELVAEWALGRGVNSATSYPDVAVQPVSTDTLVFSPRAGEHGARSLLPLCSLARTMQRGYTVPLYIVTNVEPTDQERLGLGTFFALLKRGLAWFIPCPARARGGCNYRNIIDLAHELDLIYEECSRELGIDLREGGCNIDIAQATDYMQYKDRCVLVDLESALRTYADRINCSIASRLGGR